MTCSGCRTLWILEEMPPYICRLPEYGEHYGIIEQCEQELNEAVCKCEQEWVAAVQEGIVHEEWCGLPPRWLLC